MNSRFTLRTLCGPLCLCVFVLGFLAQNVLAQQPAQAPDRSAFTFTKYNLTLTIDPETALLTARGTITLRNDSNRPQSSAALQLGSQLKWASVKIAGTPVPFETAKLDSDIDHTGAVIEATFVLPKPVAPKESFDIQVGYSGNITLDTSRLTKLRAPAEAARASDWDRISPDFTALRGVGHVVWYPVALEPAQLGQGNKLFTELGNFRARHAESSMQITQAAGEDLTQMLFSNGTASNFVSGKNSYRTLTFSHLGLDGPLLVVGRFQVQQSPQGSIYYQSDQAALAAKFLDAARKVAPEVTSWLRAPQERITIIQHPDPNAAPFESGPLLLTPFNATDKALQLQLAHTLAHAAVPSDRAWISEGLAHYAQLREREVQDGRNTALGFLLDRLPALTLDEPENAKSSPDSAARSLINTGDEVLYRTKSMYVWWMLREMLGDDPLIKALRNYRATDDKEATYMQKLIEAQSHRDLSWFFDDWVYRDRGLPDFRITQVYPRQILADSAASSGNKGGYLVTVTVENLGDCAAEVPVRVMTKEGEVMSRLQVAGKSKASARVNTLSPPLEVVVNDGSVPESDLSNNIWKPEAPK